jgi:type IV pilus assembly protein PilC
MQKEYRYRCLAPNGKTVQGIVSASNKTKARQMVQKVAEKRNLKLIGIQPRRNFIYTVKSPDGKKIKGKQSAFSKEEVAEALAKMGYHGAKIQPVLLDIKMKPPFNSIMMFVQLSSFLLNEKLSYDKILRMLADEETNPTLKETLRKIESELKKGREGTEVFNQFADVFGRFPAYMLGLATKSGNMAEVYEATAKFMQRNAEYRKSLRQATMSPALTVLFTILAVVYYVVSIFPATAEMFVKFGMEIPPMTAATLKLSHFLGANWIWMLLVIATPIVGLYLWWRTPNGRVWRDKMLIKLPVIGPLLHKSSIEIFFRVFAAVYSGAESNIETLKVAAEACNNAYIEKNIKEITIPKMLKGMALVPALEEAKVFNEATLSRLRSGAEVGNVLQSANMITTFYEKETTYKMQNLINSIQGFIGMFIALVIVLLTLVSAEIAFVSPSTPGI